MKVYTLKMALRGISPMVWRRLRVPGASSLASLHEAIQIVNGWDNDHLHRFHIYAVDYGISYAGGLSFRDNAHQVALDRFEFDVGDKFFYEYNFFKHQIVDIRVEAIKEETSNDVAIGCVKGNGMPGADKYDEMEATYQLIKAIATADDTTTMGDIRPYVDALNAVRFDRRHINHCLATELTV